MEYVRNNPLDELAGLGTQKVVDYKLDETGLPKSNVLKYYFDDNSWLALRPSGTEPKIKIYVNAVADSEKAAEDKKDQLVKRMQEVIESVD